MDTEVATYKGFWTVDYGRNLAHSSLCGSSRLQYLLGYFFLGVSSLFSSCAGVDEVSSIESVLSDLFLSVARQHVHLSLDRRLHRVC